MMFNDVYDVSPEYLGYTHVYPKRLAILLLFQRHFNPYPTNVIYICGTPCKTRNFNVVYIWTALLPSLTGGGRSVGIVRSRTEAMELYIWTYSWQR
jgi:hypothetical protein